MGKTRRKQKSFFDDDGMYDLGVDDLISYASTARRKKRGGPKKKRTNWEDEYLDYLDEDDPPVDKKENK